MNFDLPDVMVSVEPSVTRYVFSERSDLVIGQQLALNQYGTGFVNAGFDVVASGNLVVEGGELQRSVNGFQLDTSENRVGGTCVDDSGGPGYGVGQGCGIDFDFHV